MKKQTIWLIIALTVLIILFIIIKGCQPKLEQATGSKFASFDTLGITKIEIDASENNKDVILTKAGETWMLTSPIEYKADEQTIKYLMKSLSELPSNPDIISENPENQSKFEVDSTGTVVKIYEDEKIILDLIIGKTDEMGSHTYSRETDSDKVVSIPQNLSYKFEKKPDQWRDKIIVDIPAEDLNIIDIVYANNQITYTNNDSVWTIVENDESLNESPDKLRSITSAFSPLRTSQFQDEETDSDWSAPEMTIKIVTATGMEYVIRFLAKDDKNIYIKVDGNDQIFITSNYMMTRFQKTLEDYKK